MPKVNQAKNSPARSPSKLTPEEKFWEEVNQLAQEKIYQILTRIIPLPNLKLITEPYTYEDKQDKLTGLFLHKDADYRTICADLASQYDEEDLPDKEYLAEEITFHYCRLVVKALVNELSEFSCYDASYFEDLTQE